MVLTSFSFLFTSIRIVLMLVPQLRGASGAPTHPSKRVSTTVLGKCLGTIVIPLNPTAIAHSPDEPVNTSYDYN